MCPSSALTAAAIALHRGLISKQPKRLGKKGWLGKILFLPYLMQLIQAFGHNSVSYAVIRLHLACFSELSDSARVSSNLLF